MDANWSKIEKAHLFRSEPFRSTNNQSHFILKLHISIVVLRYAVVYSNLFALYKGKSVPIAREKIKSLIFSY